MPQKFYRHLLLSHLRCSQDVIQNESITSYVLKMNSDYQLILFTCHTRNSFFIHDITAYYVK